MDEGMIKTSYEQRLPLLTQLKTSLEEATRETLLGVPHLDRVDFRVKDVGSFVRKALSRKGGAPYEHPLVEIEDQVAGRIVVYFVTDLDVVRGKLLSAIFNPVEQTTRRPSRDAEFGYESDHLICNLPPHLLPNGWHSLEDMPSTFELQIRTVFMHAYAAPQHDIAYKSAAELPSEIRRELAWIAASAWGADQAYKRVREWQRAQAGFIGGGTH
jgi:putative GTP pyrophosphokinase